MLDRLDETDRMLEAVNAHEKRLLEHHANWAFPDGPARREAERRADAADAEWASRIGTVSRLSEQPWPTLAALPPFSGGGAHSPHAPREMEAYMAASRATDEASKRLEATLSALHRARVPVREPLESPPASVRSPARALPYRLRDFA